MSTWSHSAKWKLQVSVVLACPFYSGTTGTDSVQKKHTALLEERERDREVLI